MAELVHIADPRPKRALHRAHRALEAELDALMRPERAAEILDAALETVVIDDGDDPARRLRSLVGARLLDDVANLLERVAEQIQRDETPTLSVPLGLAPEYADISPDEEPESARRATESGSIEKAPTRRTG